MVRISWLVVLLYCLPIIVYSQDKTDSLEDFFDWVENHSETKAPEIIDSLKFYNELYATSQDHFLQAKVLDKLAWVYFFELSSFELSMQAIEEIHTLYSISQDERILIMYYENMGMLYFESNTDKNKAIQFFIKAYEASIKLDSHYQIESILNNYGVALMNQQRFDESRSQLFKSLMYARQNENKVQESVVWSNLGICYLLIGDIDSAEVAMLESYNVALQTPMKDDDALRAAFLGRFYQDQENYSLSLFYLKQTVEKIDYVKTFGNKAFTFKTLSDTYAKMGDYKSALENLKTYTLYKDSLDYSTVTKQLWSMEYQLKTQELEAKRKFEEAERESERYAEKLWYTIVILVLSAAGTLVFLVNVRLRAKSKLATINKEKIELEKQNLAIEVESNEREVAAKSMFLLEKDNLINKVIKHLKQLKEEVGESEKKSVQKVISELRYSLNNNSWEEFEIRFSKVHPNFYKNIEAAHTSLTSNEKKLCAFLLMDMTTKEIANITGQTSHSINVARTRLRKKLGLVNSKLTFNEFLNGFN